MFSTEIFKNTYFQEHLYLYVTLFTMHEKDTANKVKLEPSQIYMMSFLRKQLNLLALNYLHKNVPS